MAKKTIAQQDPTPQVQDTLFKKWAAALISGSCNDLEHADWVTKWLLITRAQVFTMTLTSGILGALLAWQQLGNRINLWAALLSILGIILAHASNNLLNDLTDYQGGIDTKDYPRAQYGPHALIDNLITKRTMILAILLCNLLDLVIMIVLTLWRGPIIIAFALAGLLTSLLYTGVLKKIALGEIAAFIVWGPLMIAGTAFAAGAQLTPAIWVQTIPFGLIVGAALLGKHIDKVNHDKVKNVKTIPVLIGEKNARILSKIIFILFYLFIIAQVILGYTHWSVLIVLLSLPNFRDVWETFSKPYPSQKPEGWPIWPLWFVGWVIHFTRKAGAPYILGMFLATIITNLFA